MASRSTLCSARLHTDNLLGPTEKALISLGQCYQWGRAWLLCASPTRWAGSQGGLPDSWTLPGPVAVGEVNCPQFVCDRDILGNMSVWQPWSFSIHCHQVTSRQEVHLLIF